MKRQSVKMLKDAYECAVEYYRGVIKLLLGDKTFYMLPHEVMGDSSNIYTLDLFTLANRENGDLEQLKEQVEQGIKTNYKVYFIPLNSTGLPFITVVIMDPLVPQGTPEYVLFLDRKEFYLRLDEATR